MTRAQYAIAERIKTTISRRKMKGIFPAGGGGGGVKRDVATAPSNSPSLMYPLLFSEIASDEAETKILWQDNQKWCFSAQLLNLYLQRTYHLFSWEFSLRRGGVVGD